MVVFRVHFIIQKPDESYNCFKGVDFVSIFCSVHAVTYLGSLLSNYIGVNIKIFNENLPASNNLGDSQLVKIHSNRDNDN